MTPLLLISAFVTTYVCYVQGQAPCTTPNGNSGLCNTIYQCDSLLAIVNKPTRTQQDLDILRKSQCGFQGSTPLVCCPQNNQPQQCSTPDGQIGQCIDIYSCPHIASMLKGTISRENLAYVQNSKCQGPTQYSVCCGPPPSTEPVRPTGVCSPQTAAPPDPRSECCGLEGAGGNRIIGGNATAVDQYPWLVLIEYKKNNKIKLLCGGVLISGRYVLTAGHCVAGPVLNVGTPTNVRLGEYDTNNDGPDCTPVEGGGEDCTEGVVIIPIERIIAHPDYNPSSSLRRHDIALIRLSQLAPYTDFIRPICLPTFDLTSNFPSDGQLIASGWGAVNETHSSSNVKLDVYLPFRTAEECQVPYTVPRRRVQLWKGQLCAGGTKGQDTCKGDSGGPLMYENGLRFEVVGIVSFGPTPCGLEGIPGVYTKVYEYNSWIRSNISP